MESDSKNTPPTPAAGHDRTEPDTAGYTLTIEEVSALFAEAGVPRNPRSIRRFCQHRELDCITIETPTSSRYLVRRSSVEKLIREKQQALQFGESRSSPAMTGQDQPRPDIAGHGRTHDQQQPSADETETREREEMIKRLEGELLNLRIDNRAKEQVITMLTAERREFQSQLQDISYRLGSAETRVEQLEAPRQPTSTETDQGRGGDATPAEPPAALDAEIDATPPEPEPARAEPTPPPRRGIFGGLFGS